MATFLRRTTPLLPVARRLSHPQLHSSAASREHYINATKAVFDQVVSNAPSDRVVLVDFYAEWCGPCHALSPILRDLTDTHTTGSGAPLDLLTIDIENEADGGWDLGQRFKVRALPTVIAFRKGERLAQFVGALNEGGVKKFIDGL
ncbi:thioredoxin-like protein [Mycena belliarum]|uniref:Thioredoxin-like protein n=1 Tax=Mycena belliarum TaxID=1033014 RepID=A0AAD6U1N6_9AGAR|nr:thioredoxin-like protein [Mycena belliae]